MACVASIYKNLGLYNEVEIIIGDRKILENILDCACVEKKNYYTAVKIVDDKEKIKKDEFYVRFQTLGLKSDQINFINDAISIKGAFDEGIKKIEKISKRVAEKSRRILKRLDRLSELLKWYEIYDICRLDLSVARGSFYTGIIFEVSDKKKKLGALSGGGRYDWLISMYGKRDLPAIGFGVGHLGTIGLLKQKGLFNFRSNKKNILVFCEDMKKDYKLAIKLVNILRKGGHIVEIDTGKYCHDDSDYKCVIVLKRNFYQNFLVEINIQSKKSLVKIDSFDDFSKNLTY